MKHIPLLLLFLAPTAMASTPLTGFYIKGGLGGTTAEYDATQILNSKATALSDFILDHSVDHEVRGTNWAGLLGMGYSYQLTELWILSAEFTAGYTSANGSFKNDFLFDTTSVLNAKSSMTVTNDFALVVKPGLAIYKQTQFYALLGTRWGNFENSSKASTDTDGIIGGGSSQSKNYVLGFTVGIGVERLFTKNWGLALEYAYTSYGNIPSSGISTMLEASGGLMTLLTEKTKASASTSNLLLNATYRFK